MSKCIVTWWIYEARFPIDEGWDLLQRVPAGEIPYEVREHARRIGWEGDVRGDECARFAIPTDGGFVNGYAWKQDNNGTTYIASPVQLIHLED